MNLTASEIDASPKRAGFLKKSALFFLALAIYILLFSNVDSVATLVQVAGVLLVILAGALALIAGFSREKFTAYEASLLIVAIVSIAGAVVNGNTNAPEGLSYILLYTILVFFVLFACAAIARALSLQDILRASSYAYLGMIITVAIFHSEDILQGLNANGAEHWADRARAFNLHPNLEGYIFGGGFFLMLGRSFQVGLVWRPVYWLASALCIAIVLAASARASLLADVVSIGLTSLISFPRLKLGFRIGGAIVVVAVLIGCVVKAEAIGSYLWTILELGSQTRGIDSGGSGRTGLWAQGIALIFSSPTQAFLGSGLRSSTADLLGFSVESSYITILIDSGMIFGGFFIISMLVSCAKSMWWVRSRKNVRFPDVTITMLIMFALIESVLNRYLFSIANPFSVFMILIFIYASGGRIKNSAAR